MGTNRKIRPWTMVAWLLALVLVAAACSADGDDAETASDSEASESEGEDSDSGAGSGGDIAAEPGSDGPVSAQVGAASTDRLLRREAHLVVEVQDLEAAQAAASNHAQSRGGFLSNEHTTPSSSDMTLRVPNDDFDQVLAQLADLGELREQTITTDDRTEVIVDLEARLATAEASLERTRGFFEQTATVGELTELEREVANREGDVASLRAQLESEQGSVALSTIRVNFLLDPALDPEGVVESDEPLPGVLDALASGWDLLRSVLYALALALVWLLPWAPVLVGAYLAYRWARSRWPGGSGRRQRSAPRSATPVPPPPAPEEATVGADPGDSTN